MWNSARKKSILSARELLRITRPDTQTLVTVKRGVWFLLILVTFLITLLLWPQIKAQLSLFVLLLVLMVFIVAALLTRVTGTQAVIFTEKGIIQQWNKAVLWEDMEGYTWMPVGRKYSLLRISPSNSMPIFWQIDNIKGGFGPIHSESKKAIEELLQNKGKQSEGL